MSKGTDFLGYEVAFQGYLYRNQPWKTEHFPLEQRAGFLIDHCNGFEFPKLRVSLLSCNTLHVQLPSRPLCITLWELGLKELPQENLDTLLLCHWVIKSFASGPGVLCLLPVSMKLCVLSHFSHVRLSATPWTVAHQAPLSMGFSRQEDWSGLPCPSPGDLPNPGIEL